MHRCRCRSPTSDCALIVRPAGRCLRRAALAEAVGRAVDCNLTTPLVACSAGLPLSAAGAARRRSADSVRAPSMNLASVALSVRPTCSKVPLHRAACLLHMMILEACCGLGHAGASRKMDSSGRRRLSGAHTREHPAVDDARSWLHDLLHTHTCPLLHASLMPARISRGLLLFASSGHAPSSR